MGPIRSTKPGVFSKVSMIVSIVWSLWIKEGRKCVLYHGVFVECFVDHIGENILSGWEIGKGTGSVRKRWRYCSMGRSISSFGSYS